MLWRNLNFWRLTTFALFAVILIIAFRGMGVAPKFILEDSSMELRQEPQYGALFRFTIRNEGAGGDAYVNGNVYLYERGGDTETDYTTMGINADETKSGELFIPLRPGQTVHDWRIEIVN
ncbi:MAG: hypothetical protein ACYC6B_08420 [Thermoleophilia bacterium]